MENEVFEAIYLYYIIKFNIIAIKISPDQHAGLLRFLFTEDSLKIKKGLIIGTPGRGGRTFRKLSHLGADTKCFARKGG